MDVCQFTLSIEANMDLVDLKEIENKFLFE